MRVLRLNSGFKVNKIIIISHLRDGDAKSCLRLYEDLETLNKVKNGLDVEYINVEGVGDFLFNLEEIFKRCKWLFLRPVIHIECHGDKVKGLDFCDGYLSWNYLGCRIREINYVSGNNLVVSMATCYGVNAYAAPLRHDRICPAWYLVAPDRRVKAGDLLSFYLRFYSELAVSKNMETVDDVVREHGVAKSIYSSRFIVMTLARYLHKQCRGKGKAARVEDIVTLSKWINADMRISSIRRNRAMAKDFFGLDERVFVNVTRRFLLNEERAGCTWNELKDFLG